MYNPEAKRQGHVLKCYKQSNAKIRYCKILDELAHPFTGSFSYYHYHLYQIGSKNKENK
jgi:hypothetical protein